MTKTTMRASNTFANVFFALARIGTWIARQASRVAWRFSYCTQCGENRYYGRTCKEVEADRAAASAEKGAS